MKAIFMLLNLGYSKIGRLFPFYLNAALQIAEAAVKLHQQKVIWFLQRSTGAKEELLQAVHKAMIIIRRIRYKQIK
jgi:hypothetical protein